MEGRRRPTLDPVLVDGPPTPDWLAAQVGLNPAQEARYTTLYRGLMDSTRAEREEARQARDALRVAAERRDRSALRAAVERMQRPMEALDRQQKLFDAALESFLTGEQLRQYGLWRESRRRRVEGGPGAGGPV